jgi:hypothetical protein
MKGKNMRKYLLLKDKIKKSLNELNQEDLIQFGIYSVERTIEQYKYFDEEYDISLMDKTIPKGTGYKIITDLFDFAKKDVFLYNAENVSEKIEKCKKLIPDPEVYDLDWICRFAELITRSIMNIMESHINNNKSCYFTDCCLEIINQIRGAEYYEQEERTNAFSVDNEYLEEYFINELETEEKIIEMIRNNEDKENVNIFINNNKIA